MLSKSTKNTILRQLLGQTNSTVASTCYLGLLHAEPTEDATGVHYDEATSITSGGIETGYERTMLGTANQSATYKMNIEDGEALNKDVIYLAECLESEEAGYPEHPWGECTYFGLFTAKTNGTLLAWGRLLDKNGDPVTINPTWNQIPVIRKEQLEITIE